MIKTDSSANETDHLAQTVDLIDSNAEVTETKVKCSAMTLVIKHLSVQPHTCSALVQKIGIYSSSHISRCLRKLKKAGLIGAVWDFQQVALVYYNLKLGEDE
ncbi:hypothetical protein [Allocoleopsis sp.]|uniref:hypothetical protein n=1 Tax=Allocoleopsis sp. TaxID=3088169 RepID=UPI002FD026DD